MKRIVSHKVEKDIISIADIASESVIVSKKGGKIVAFVCKEDGLFILKYPDGSGATGHHKTLELLMESVAEFGHELFLLD
jgi:hypothetical protein